jgi:chromosomal replication initiator protein
MEFTAPELWSRVLAVARTEMPDQSYRTWLSGSSAVGLSENELIVEAPSDFHVEWMEDKYGPLLHELVDRIVGRPLRIGFRCAPAPSDAAAAAARADAGRPGSGLPAVEVASEEGTPPAESPSGSGPAPGLASPSRPAPQGSPERSGEDAARSASLNERYTFGRFVVGTNNQLAAAACRAVAEQPARIYNPLFLYGGVGLGKTHLMHAIGHELLKRKPHALVSYVTTERFMNELVYAIQKGTTPEFRRRFRHIDLLMVDDVHFLEEKESTQEEFFHTFNALYDAGKQIVLTSDRPPKELGEVEDRLVSRFEWGLVADIKPPDYETRVAILQNKASYDGLVLDAEVFDFIARSCTSSVRELEGAVIKLLAYSSLRNEEITLSLARMALQSMVRDGKPGKAGSHVTAERVRNVVAEAYGVRPDALSSKKRTREVTVPRQVAMYLIKELLDESLVRIGRAFGGRDHSTVIHSIRRTEAQMSSDESFAERVNEIRSRLEARS